MISFSDEFGLLGIYEGPWIESLPAHLALGRWDAHRRVLRL